MANSSENFFFLNGPNADSNKASLSLDEMLLDKYKIRGFLKQRVLFFKFYVSIFSLKLKGTEYSVMTFYTLNQLFLK
jgi:hypothetical protein